MLHVRQSCVLIIDYMMCHLYAMTYAHSLFNVTHQQETCTTGPDILCVFNTMLFLCLLLSIVFMDSNVTEGSAEDTEV